MQRPIAFPEPPVKGGPSHPPVLGPFTLMVIPQLRNVCFMFSGKGSVLCLGVGTGMGLVEWMERGPCRYAGQAVIYCWPSLLYLWSPWREAKEEIKFRPRRDWEDPEVIFSILQELYGVHNLNVALQEQFFSRTQLDGESLQEYSHALFALIEKAVKNAPNTMPNSEILLKRPICGNCQWQYTSPWTKADCLSSPSSTLS